MRRVKAKLRSCRGETLVELLASILVAALSVGLLMGGVAVSAQLGRQAADGDERFYETLTAAESRRTPVTEGVAPSPQVRVTEEGKPSMDLPVQVYGGRDLYSYQLDAEGGDEP